MRAIAAAGVLVPSLAFADGRPEVALAVNPPLGWYKAQSIGGSAYVGYRRHAVRLNVASYYHTDDVEEIFHDITSGGGPGYGEDETGRRLDLGLGWMYFPRKLWSGPTFELGLLVRDTFHRRQEAPILHFTYPAYVTDSLTIAGRGLVGWSWLMFDHAFISVAAGVAMGVVSGTRRELRDEVVVMSHGFQQRETKFELFIRFGGAFGL